MPMNLIHAQIGVRAVRERHRARGTRQFFHSDEVLKVP
jgi:hypothetical protein